eukprot:150439-Chlamydomonas_euryale.AAC.1
MQIPDVTCGITSLHLRGVTAWRKSAPYTRLSCRGALGCWDLGGIVNALHHCHQLSPRVEGNGKRRPPSPFPRRKRPFPCGSRTAISMWKRDVVSFAARTDRQAPIVWAALP